MFEHASCAVLAKASVKFSAVNIFEVRESLLQGAPIRRTYFFLAVCVKAKVAIVTRLGPYNVGTLFLSVVLAGQLLAKVHAGLDLVSQIIF